MFSNDASSQDGSLPRSLIRSLSQYRSNVLVDNVESLKRMDTIIREWRAIESDEEKLHDFIASIQYQKEIGLYSNKKVIKNINKHMVSKALAQKLTYMQINTIIENSELTDLIVHDILDQSYPHRIIKNIDLSTELAFYNIQENETIAEIGAGKGTFSFILYLLDQSNKIYVNEVDYELLSLMEKRIQNGNLPPNNSELILIKGKKRKTKIPEQVDKIIIRNSFHHFSKKDRMLQSIKDNLKEGGKLYINEIPKGHLAYSCKLRMSEEEIKSSIKSNGFALTRELKLENTILLEFMKM